MGKLRALAKIMLSIGFWGYGGGTALIPVIEEALEESQELSITGDQFNKDVVAATITPGALPVEIAAGVGWQTAGSAGMVLSSTAMALPGALMTLLLVSVLTQASGNLLTCLSYVSVGISSYIVFLLGLYITGSVRESKKELPHWGVYLIVGLVTFLTGGKHLYKILGLDGAPVFRLSTIHVLALAFFLIFYVGGNWHSRRRWPIAVMVSLLYILRISGWNWMMFPGSLNAIKGVMVLLSVYSLARHVRENRDPQAGVTLEWKPLLRDTAVWLLFLLIFSAPALIFAGEEPLFIPKALLSTTISFGGGDAYLAAADGIFVADQMISSSEFYGLLIPVVNALPGSILCKTLSGIGYFVGCHATGTLLGGWLVALSGLACSIAASGWVFIVVFHLYTAFERIPFFDLLRRWIGPIIVGLLLSVALSMFYENLNIGDSYGWPPFAAGALSIGIFCMDEVLFHRLRMKKIVLLGLSGALSLVFGVVFTM